MILVFYIFLGILFFITLVMSLIYISKLEIKIENLDMNNINKKKNNEKILIQISLKLHNIRWIRLKMNKEKLANLYGTIKRLEYKNNISSKIMKEKAEKEIKIILKDKKLNQKILNTNIELEKFNANISLGTEDYIITSYLVALIAIIISNILPHIIKDRNVIDKIKYKVLPVYEPSNVYSIKLSTILNVKISNLINIAVMLKKVGKSLEQNKDYKYKNIENLERINTQTA